MLFLKNIGALNNLTSLYNLLKKILSAQWIQAKKQGIVINFKQWRDWKGLPLFGMEWYKENTPQDEELTVENYAYIQGGQFYSTEPDFKQYYTCQYTINCSIPE